MDKLPLELKLKILTFLDNQNDAEHFAEAFYGEEREFLLEETYKNFSWDNPKIIHTVDTQADDCRWTPDGEKIIAVSTKCIYVYDNTLKLCSEQSVSNIGKFKISPDSKHIALRTWESTVVYSFDGYNLNFTCEFPIIRGEFDWMKDSKRLVVCTCTGMYILNTVNNSVHKIKSYISGCHTLSSSPCDNRVAFVLTGTKIIYIYNVETSEITEYKIDFSCKMIKWLSKDKLAILGFENNIIVFDIDNCKIELNIRLQTSFVNEIVVYSENEILSHGGLELSLLNIENMLLLTFWMTTMHSDLKPKENTVISLFYNKLTMYVAGKNNAS